MANGTDVQMEVSRLTGVVSPLGWDVAATDFRSDQIVVTLTRDKPRREVPPAGAPVTVPPGT